MQDLLNLSQQQIHILDKQGKIIYANDSFLQSHGYQQEDLPIDIRYIECNYDPKNIEKAFSLVNEKPVIFLTRHKHVDGHEFDIEVTLNAAEWQGKPVYFASGITTFKRSVKDEQSTDIDNTFFNFAERDKALRKAQTWLNFSGDAFHIVDTNGRLIECAPSFLSLLGYEDKDLAELDISAWAKSSTLIESIKRLKAFSQTQNTWQTLILPFTRKDGSTFEAELKIISVVVDDETLIYGTVRDISERISTNKKLELALRSSEELAQKFQAFFANAPEAYLIFDWLTGRVIESNESAGSMLGIPQEQVIGMLPTDFSPALQPDGERSASKLKKEMKKIAKNGTGVFEWLHQRQNGETFWVEVENYIGKVGQQDVAFVTWRDITKRKALEADRQLALQNLSEKKLQQEKLFATIGHELRTPAAVLAMLLENDNQDRNLLKKASEHLINILDDMRVVTNPELLITGKVIATDIPSIVHEALEFKQRAIQESQLNVHLDIGTNSDLTCLVNAQLLRQICVNLLQNVLLHSGAKDLWITITYQHNNTHNFTITFDDNGCGIDEELSESIFQPFERGQTSADGMGLGLNLSREFAQKHLAGDLTYQRSQKGGACFVVTTKFETPNEISNEPKQLTTASFKDLRILYAEDNQTLRVLTEYLLVGAGAHVDCFVDGQEALNAFSQNHYDLVISDIFMPNMDGYQLTKQLRAKGFTLPIIGATAATIGDEIDKMLEAGADKVISKPFTIEQIKQAFSETLLKSNQQTSTDAHQEYAFDIAKIMNEIGFQQDVFNSLLSGAKLEINDLNQAFSEALNNTEYQKMLKHGSQLNNIATALHADRLIKSSDKLNMSLIEKDQNTINESCQDVFNQLDIIDQDIDKYLALN